MAADLCEPKYDVLLTVALWSSPEVSAHAVSHGVISPALMTILQLCVGAALGLDTDEVALSEVKFSAESNKTQEGNISSLASLLTFDLSFSFCAAPSKTPGIDPREFERHVIQVTQKFAAFHMGTIRLLSLRGHGIPLSEATWGGWTSEPLNTSNATSSLTVNQAPPDVDSTSGTTWELLAYIVWGLLGFSFFSVFLVRIWLVCRKRYGAGRNFTDDVEAPAHQTPVEVVASLEVTPGRSGSPRHGHRQVEGAMVLAKSAFDPSEAEHHPQFSGRYLKLRTGDVMEVVSDSGGGWLNGFHVGHRDQLGYFPETRVSWIGRPLPRGPFNVASSTCSLGVPEDTGLEGDAVVDSVRSRRIARDAEVAPSSARAGTTSSVEEDLIVESARSRNPEHLDSAPAGPSTGRGRRSTTSQPSSGHSDDLVVESARSQYPSRSSSA